MKLLNDRHDYNLDIVLLSVDEGITGYRDDSLEVIQTVNTCVTVYQLKGRYMYNIGTKLPNCFSNVNLMWSWSSYQLSQKMIQSEVLSEKTL